MKSTQPTNIAITVGTVLLIGWWTAPFRQQAVSFHMCVETFSQNQIRLNKRLTPALHRMRAVSLCNGGDP